MSRESRQTILHQEWRSLLFLHWKFEPALIQERLPKGLEVDTLQGKAYLGIVAFYMHGLRPKFLPPCPGISNFPELNLRTYVRHRDGRSGVWFFSLDAHSRLSVLIAQKLFGLPYHAAKMRYTIRRDKTVEFDSKRVGELSQSFKYRPSKTIGMAKSGTLDHFLVERYRLFALKAGTLKVGELAHEPYQLNEVDVSRYSTELFQLNQFTTPKTEPDHAIFSKGVRVKVYPFVDELIAED